jgi:peptidoglycan/LPS O-acetylase OafA/YrhL
MMARTLRENSLSPVTELPHSGMFLEKGRGMVAPDHNADRNPALDFTKGTLVLFMVLYHWINYFVSTQGSVYAYLRFITPSFIFIAGFVIANVYPAKYGWGNPRASERLMSRGLKLLALFTVLNITANAMFASGYKGAMPGIEGFIRNAASIYISGNAIASFGVLVPISYLLLLSAGIFLAGPIYKYSVPLICGVAFLCVAFLNLYGRSSVNLEMVAIGLLGMVLGLEPIERINRWVDQPVIFLSLNVGYILATTIWGSVYFLLVGGVCLSVMLIYLIGMKSVAWSRIQPPIILLGKYSLFGYVAQIGLLQLLHRSLPHLNLGISALWIISFVGAFVLTVMTVKMLHWTRTKSHAVDRLYRAIFA